MTSVSDGWHRIDRWLARNAPESAGVLAGPADSAAIAAAEAELGLEFPTELRESLRRHDGLTEWAVILPVAPPLSVVGVVERRQTRMQIAADENVNGFVAPAGFEPWWHELWLPFGDADGDLQIIDMRSGSGYLRVGVAPHDNPADFSDAWPSLGAYLTAVADALETGGDVAGSWRPYLTADNELWWDMPGETELNGEPLRPAPTTAS